MDRMIYIGMSGASQLMQQQASNNHNLANLNTTGFKAEMDSFVSRPIYGPGHPGRVYATDEHAGADHASGTLTRTGRALDVAVHGNGYIAVQDIDGSEAYTRAGDLRVSPTGLLETARGEPVLGEAGPITLTPHEDLVIGADGTITVRPLGQSAGELVVLDRIKLVNPEPSTLERNARGLFSSPNIDEPPDAQVVLSSETLENSNVNAVDALVTMIELARQFETQVKLMKAAEDNDTQATRLLRTGG